MAKIYTRGGDNGRTSLADGTRVDKDDIRLEAYGSIDELGAHLGLLSCMCNEEENRHFIEKIQNLLFSIGGYLATPSSKEQVVNCWITDTHVKMLESVIDTLEEQVEPLHTFILSGGCPASAQAHVCRTVCRRAERCIIKLSKTTFIDSVIIRFVNRLSDYLFVLARWINKKSSVDEIIWQKDADQ